MHLNHWNVFLELLYFGLYSCGHVQGVRIFKEAFFQFVQSAPVVADVLLHLEDLHHRKKGRIQKIFSQDA